MTAVRITEIAGGESGSFTARVSFGDAAEYQVEVSDPADAATERLLAWYFEEQLRFPFLDRDIERQAVAQLRLYGEALFGQVFGQVAAYDYRRLRERSFDGCRLEVTGSAGFHLLHWEALRDPDLDGPLSVRLPVTRRVGLLPSRFELPSAQPTLNILLVTARPFGRGDVGYRTVSRPLLDALRQASVPVTVDLVRPGTWEALRAHLRDRARRDGSGWYQVAHFDLHGGFSGFGELDEQRSAGRLLFAGAKVDPFEGKRPFLFFETAQEGKAAAVPAASVASLLAEHRVPVAVLNACQSAMQAGSEASLAQYLVEAGVPAAVGMAYSVTVSAAALAMPVLYGQLTRGADPVAALHAARQTLHDDPARRAYFDQELDLQDWVLPVGFSQQPVPLRLRPMDEAEQARFYQRQVETGSEPATEHGFVGRDLDIQAAERRLLAGQDSNELLVQGMAGAGKSTFLAHLAWWWQRTSLVQQVFRFSWEDRAWTAAQIIREIRVRLLSPVEQAKADKMTTAAQLEQAAELLRSARHLLILDNAESITATPAAIPHAIDPAEQAQLRTLLMRLHGGKTLVVVGSREAEAWLAPGTFADNAYLLPGLDPQAATALTDRILRRHHATRWLDDDAERQALHDLTGLLGGYPLPMTIVFPMLKDTAPSEILAELKEGDVSPSETFSVARAIELSYGKLSSSMQTSLLMFAPFTNVISIGILDEYCRLLDREQNTQQIDVEGLESSLRELVNVGLATPNERVKGILNIHPVLPYFLRYKLRESGQSPERIYAAFYELYLDLGQMIYAQYLCSPDPGTHSLGQAIMRAEYANLNFAQDHGLENHLPIEGIMAALEQYLDQTKQQEARRNLLEKAISAYGKSGDTAQRIELAKFHSVAGMTARDQRRLDDAHKHFTSELDIARATSNDELQADAYVGIGSIAFETKNYVEAESSYRNALRIETKSNAHARTANTHERLCAVYIELGRLNEAQAEIKHAIEIFDGLGNEQMSSIAQAELGNVYLKQGLYEEAIGAYHVGLNFYVRYNDRHGAAGIYYGLSLATLAQGSIDESNENVRRALRIYLELSDVYLSAICYMQLGRIALISQRSSEASALFEKARSIYAEYGDYQQAANAEQMLRSITEER